MNVSKQIAKHVREVYFGGNWTVSCLKDNLADVSWEQAITQVYNLNTIATLVYHVNYYVSAVLKVLEGEALNARDKDSFEHPRITSEEDWTTFLDKGWANAEQFAQLIEELPEDKLGEIFSKKEYGLYYRNLHGIIEHIHYHLGQIVIIKKIGFSKK